MYKEVKLKTGDFALQIAYLRAAKDFLFAVVVVLAC